MNLKEIVICPICQTPHKKADLAFGETAHCSLCGARLYRKIPGLESKVAIVSVSGLIFFFIALSFELIDISMGFFEGKSTLLDAIWALFEQSFIVVAFFAALVLVIYPFLLLLFAFLWAMATLIGAKEFSKRMLQLFSHTAPWSMIDIFFVSILVAMVKIFEYADIEFGIAFWALVYVVGVEIYLIHYIGSRTMWEYWEERFEVS